MIDETLLNSLSAKEKEIFKQGLENLIDQTYVIEKEYKALNHSYTALQSTIQQIVETLPNAIWVLDEEKNLFLQNSEAKKIDKLLPKLELEKSNNEIEFNDAYYLIKIVNNENKTIISATDITDEKRKERLASMGQVAAHLSHEIRNPIGSISLLTSTLFNKVDVKSKPIVLEMKKAIWRVERIIKATLLFTKGVHVNPAYFTLNELEIECQEAVNHYTYSTNIDFNFSLPKTLYNGDKNLLSLVLQNLLFNAIDAIEECDTNDGCIDVKYKESGLYHYIDIIDSGKEIENKNILFQPFKTTKTKGNGLGLALSMQIMESHEGTLELLDNPKRFRMKLKKSLND